MLTIDKEIIKKNFSRYAPCYDRYASVQKLCASRLIDMFGKTCFKKILDLGCGTGNYTRLLTDRFPKASIVALDISEEMIRIAKEKLLDKRIEFVVADAETADLAEEFDLITSNASLQWFGDMAETLRRYRKLLAKNGVIAFSVFGPFTFYELNSSLKEIFQKDVSTNSSHFIKGQEISSILSRLFKKSEVRQFIHKEKYQKIAELFEKIKYTGARGNGLNMDGFWTPRFMHKLEKIYKTLYNDIVATYDMLFCRGAK